MTNTVPYSLLTGTLTQEHLTRQNADAARVQELLLAENSALRATLETLERSNMTLMRENATVKYEKDVLSRGSAKQVVVNIAVSL